MRRHPSEQPEPLQVVTPLGAAGVEIRIARTLVQVRCVDDISRHTAERNHTQTQADASGPEHRADLAHQPLLLDTLHDGRQAGQHQTHISALRHQRLWQGTQHIGQAAGLDKRKHFRIARLTDRSRAASAYDAAVAYCQGTPLRNEIEARGPTRLQEVTELATEAIAGRFGRGAVDGEIQAHVMTVTHAKP
jgi:hypothetical protein